MEKPYVIIPLLLIVTFGIFFNVVLNQEKSETKEETKTEVAFDGEAVYKESCIGCHGDAYKGSVGPKLTGLSEKYSEEEVANILKEGKGTGMPAGLLKGQEEAMAKFLVNLK